MEIEHIIHNLKILKERLNHIQALEYELIKEDIVKNGGSMPEEYYLLSSGFDYVRMSINYLESFLLSKNEQEKEEA